MRFNRFGDATDANYMYGAGGTTLAVGSRVKVVNAGMKTVGLSPQGEAHVYYLELRYGWKQIRPAQYFGSILVDTDPHTALAHAAPNVQEAVHDIRLLPGMTKEEALTARGYPPFHQTMSVAADDWIYYESPGFVDRVHFVDGKITTIEKTDAPE